MPREAADGLAQPLDYGVIGAVLRRRRHASGGGETAGPPCISADRGCGAEPVKRVRHIHLRPALNQIFFGGRTVVFSLPATRGPRRRSPPDPRSTTATTPRFPKHAPRSGTIPLSPNRARADPCPRTRHDAPRPPSPAAGPGFRPVRRFAGASAVGHAPGPVHRSRRLPRSGGGHRAAGRELEHHLGHAAAGGDPPLVLGRAADGDQPRGAPGRRAGDQQLRLLERVGPRLRLGGGVDGDGDAHAGRAHPDGADPQRVGRVGPGVGRLHLRAGQRSAAGGQLRRGRDARRTRAGAPRRAARHRELHRGQLGHRRGRLHPLARLLGGGGERVHGEPRERHPGAGDQRGGGGHLHRRGRGHQRHGDAQGVEERRRGGARLGLARGERAGGAAARPRRRRGAGHRARPLRLPDAPGRRGRVRVRRPAPGARAPGHARAQQDLRAHAALQQPARLPVPDRGGQRGAERHAPHAGPHDRHPRPGVRGARRHLRRVDAGG